MIFSFKVSNYDNSQSSKYEETKPGCTTLGLVEAEKNAISKFRDEYPNNTDKNQYLVIKRSTRVK